MSRWIRIVGRVSSVVALVTGLLAFERLAFGASADRPDRTARADAVVDLRTEAGASLVGGEWRFHDTKIVEVEHHWPGPDLKPSGAPNRTHELNPHAAVPDFDDSGWEKIAAETLDARRSTGRLSFAWYRLDLVLPEKVGSLPVAGSTVFFEIVIDDYAEVSVNGRQPLVLGQVGGPVVAGFNAPNRVLLTRDAKPGQRFQLAVLGINGPLSEPPGNFIWVRSATLDFYAPARAAVGVPVDARFEKRDPAFDEIVPPGTRVERLASGFDFIEGPVWHPDGYLLFSEPNNNAIYRWSPLDGAVSVFRTHSGYAGVDIGEYGQPGSNGLTLDANGRLTICEHGNHRISRLEKNGQLTVLADRYDGKRLNSPNDLVYQASGALYFTDPPFGLPKFYDDPRRELDVYGVYRYADGKLTLVDDSLRGPNGLAFSPDERYLYVDNWDERAKIVKRFEVKPDGTLTNGSVFFDMGGAPGAEALDGLKVDQQGNLYVSGPGGLWVISPQGQHLGTISLPDLPANFAWGDDDGRTLYLTARSNLYRVRLGIPGIRPPLAAPR